MTKTKNNLLVKLLVAVAFVLSAICMTACAKANKNISKISVVSSTVPAEIVVGKFDEAGIKIKVEYEDGSSAEMAVTTSMLDDNAKQLVNTKSGSYIITIKFRGEETKITVNVIEATEVHTVKFYNAYGYMIYRDDNVRHGQASTLPSDASVECPGYTFVEWDRATDNVTGDIDVYGIYYKVDETMTSAQMESKLISANQYYRTTSHTISYEDVETVGNLEEGVSPVITTLAVYRSNFHYTSSTEYSAQTFYTNSEGQLNAEDCAVANGLLTYNQYKQNTSKDGWVCIATGHSLEEAEKESGTDSILDLVLRSGSGLTDFNVSEYLKNATSKNYAYKKYTNGKNVYVATYALPYYDENTTYKAEVTFDDNKILGFKETTLKVTGEKREFTLYIDYVEKTFEDLNCQTKDKASLVAQAKELISALKSSNHTLISCDSNFETSSSSQTFTYDATTKNYNNSDSSVVLPIISNFDANIDSCASITYQLDDKTNKYVIKISLNGKLYGDAEYLTIAFDNNKVEKFTYYTPTDESVSGSHPNEYYFNIVYSD